MWAHHETLLGFATLTIWCLWHCIMTHYITCVCSPCVSQYIGASCCALGWYCYTAVRVLQWNLSNVDTLGTKIIVLISEVSIFQGENNMYLKL